MQSTVSPGTKIALYADDTKIWRYIMSPDDNLILQNDINALYQWSLRNKMKFHAKKCFISKSLWQKSLLRIAVLFISIPHKQFTS